MNSTNALLLAGDQFHDPNDAFQGVGSVLEEDGISVRCTEDYAGLGKSALEHHNLLVMHRDGIEFPQGREAGPVPWMVPEQEEAIEEFAMEAEVWGHSSLLPLAWPLGSRSFPASLWLTSTFVSRRPIHGTG